MADGTPGELESRSRYHHAVRVRLTNDYDLAADLADIPEVNGVEQDSEEELTFTILATEGKPIFAQISEIAQSRHWPVTEFHVSRGELEDVFRSVTQGPQQLSGKGA